MRFKDTVRNFTASEYILLDIGHREPPLIYYLRLLFPGDSSIVIFHLPFSLLFSDSGQAIQLYSGSHDLDTYTMS